MQFQIKWHHKLQGKISFIIDYRSMTGGCVQFYLYLQKAKVSMCMQGQLSRQQISLDYKKNVFKDIDHTTKFKTNVRNNVIDSQFLAMQ